MHNFDQVCTQALDLISRQFKEEMDTQYKILRLSNNYKGMSESDSSPVRSCAVPDEKAFHSLHQIFITPTDVEIIKSLQENASPAVNRNGYRKKKGKDGNPSKAVPPIAPVGAQVDALKSSAAGEIILSERDRAQPPASALSRFVNARLVPNSDPRDSGVTSEDAVVVYEKGNFLVVDSTKNNNLNNVVKIIVKPLSECNVANQSFNHNFNDVLNDLKRFEHEYNDMILKPQPGYVIATSRWNKGQKIYVNVCHHKKVGLLTASQSGLSEYIPKMDSNGQLMDSNFPYIIGSINKLYSDKFLRNSINGKPDPDANSGKIVAVTIDIVIPSSLWTLMIEKDLTGDIREKVRFKKIYLILVLDMFICMYSIGVSAVTRESHLSKH